MHLMSRPRPKFRPEQRGLDYVRYDRNDPAQPFTPQQHAAFAASIDKVYNGFITRVAEGRHIPAARVQEIAKGRVWTGVQAKQLGLVDDLGRSRRQV